MFNSKLIFMKIYYYAFAFALGITFASCSTDEMEPAKNKQIQYQQREATDSTAVADMADMSHLTDGGANTGLEDGDPVVIKGKDN